MGTPFYKPPELWLGEKKAGPPTPATDVYSLACLLVEMLSGVRPFQGDTPAEVMTAHILALPDLPEKWPPAAPAGLEAVIRKALASEREARYPSAGAFLAAIRDLIAAEEARKADTARKRREAREQEKREAEEKARQEAIAQAVRQAEQKTRRETEARLRETEARELRRQPAIENQPSQTLTLAPGVELELVRVPAGPFWMGSDKRKDKAANDDGLPQHEVVLEAYWIGKYPLTNRQYQAYVQAAQAAAPRHWEKGKIPKGKEDHPVVNVSWDDAAAFCEWASRETGQNIRLPSEAEWEKAARGAPPQSPPKSGGKLPSPKVGRGAGGEGGGRLYPWGDQPPNENLCNFGMNVKDTTPVGKYSPGGDSPYGCADMTGNVWEWTRSIFKKYPYDPADGREDPKASGGRVLRGGSWGNNGSILRVAYRNYGDPSNTNNFDGFRCARSP